MSAVVLLFLWGDLYYTARDAQRYLPWSYLGTSLGLVEYAKQYNDFDNCVDVYRVDDHSVGWVDSPVRHPSRKRRIL